MNNISKGGYVGIEVSYELCCPNSVSRIRRGLCHGKHVMSWHWLGAECGSCLTKYFSSITNKYGPGKEVCDTFFLIKKSLCISVKKLAFAWVFGIETEDDLGRKREKKMVFLVPSQSQTQAWKKRETHNGDFSSLSPFWGKGACLRNSKISNTDRNLTLSLWEDGRYRRLILLPSSFFPRILGVKLWGKYSFPHSEKTLGKEEEKNPGAFFLWPDLRFKRIYQEITESTNKPPRSDARRHHFFSQL